MPNPKDLIEGIYSPTNLERIDSDYRKYKIYNGKLRDEIKDAISKEFILKETIQELCKRVIPINITQKVTNKLAQVYKTAPVRKSANENDDDTESFQNLAEVMRANQIGKSVNRYFKLNKSSLYEPYVSRLGVPQLRSIPSYAFTQFSDDEIEPDKPTHTVKHLHMVGGNKKEHRHVVWSADEHYVMNGEGAILSNPGNSYGVNPLVYVKEGDCLMPIPDDDLYFLQIAICLLLTDLAFASKYQAWSVIYLIGADSTTKLSFNPSSVINLPFGRDGEKPEVGTIKPTLDTDALLSQVEALIGLLLTTKSLSVGSMTMSLNGSQGTPQAAAAKILDNAETTEDQQDQRQYFVDAETELWMKTVDHILPVWKKQNLIDPRFAFSFSSDFQPSITFEDPRPVISEEQQVKNEKAKVDAGFSTKKAAMQRLYPNSTSEEIDKMIEEIKQEERDGFTQVGDQSSDLNQ